MLVVAVVLTTSPQGLRREVKRFRTRLRKKKQQLPELKASRSAPAWNRKRLKRLAQLEIEVVVIIAEKLHLPPPPHLDPEELYRLLCTQAVEECLRRSPSLTLRVDKRYTNPPLRAVQERALREAVEGPGRTLTLEHMDSSHDPALQLADLVAWAFLQKYERGDGSFAAVIQQRVIVEETLRRVERGK